LGNPHEREVANRDWMLEPSEQARFEQQIIDEEGSKESSKLEISKASADSGQFRQWIEEIGKS